jgi:putative spermidine/putrescine transport system permease protein
MSAGTASALVAPTQKVLVGRTEGLAGRIVVRTLIAVALIAIFLPLVLTIYISVFNEKIIVFPPRGYTLSWYATMLDQFGGPILTSIEIAVGAAFFAMLAGVPAGIGLSRYRFRGRGAISMLLLAPLTIPGIAVGLGIYVLAIWIEEQTSAALAGSLTLLILAHVMICLPWVVRLCLASLSTHERDAEEAAASLGATPAMVVWRVTLPAMRSGIIAGALFAFIVSFENLEMTLFLIAPGMTTLPIQVLQYLQYHIDPAVAAVAVAQMVIVGAMLVVLDRFVRLSQAVR